jgi:hypothetical protein
VKSVPSLTARNRFRRNPLREKNDINPSRRLHGNYMETHGLIRARQAVNSISNMSTSMGAPAASARASSATIVAIINQMIA